MQYVSNTDLPKSVRDILPDEAQTIWRKIVNSAIEIYGDEKRAFVTAWAGLRRAGWEKEAGKWTKIEKDSPSSSSVHVNTPLGEKLTERLKRLKERDPEDIEKYNPYHGKDGRFTQGGGNEHSVSLSERSKSIVARHEAEGKYKSAGGGGSSAGGSEAKSKAEFKPTKSMTNSIELYSSTSYTDIRSGKRPKDAQNIEDFIAGSTKHEGTIHRGMNASDDFMSNLKSGGNISMNGISSWSGDKKQASSFMRGNGNKVMFEVNTSKHGADISHLSNFQNEKEVLMSSKANFKVSKIEKVSDTVIGGDGRKNKVTYTKVTLEEL